MDVTPTIILTRILPSRQYCKILHAVWNKISQNILHVQPWVCDTDRSTRAIMGLDLARYVKLRVVHAPGMPGTFSPPPRISDPGMHQGTCVTHVPWCMPGSLASGFLLSRWWGKRSRHSRRMRNLQLYESGKRPTLCTDIMCTHPSMNNHPYGSCVTGYIITSHALLIYQNFKR